MVISLSGFLAGALGAGLLRRLGRGADVPWLWCAVPTALLWIASDVPGNWLPLVLGLAWLGVLLAATDFRHRRLPDALTLPAYPAVATGLVIAGADLKRAAVGCALFLGVHLAVHKMAPHALGGGDVKLAGSLGAVLGALEWVALPLGALVASALTLVVASVRPKDGIPHGPGLLAATWLLAVVAL